MTKEEILDEIRRVAADNGGVAPGRRNFEVATGIGQPVWYGKYWARWSDALREVGLRPNTKQQAYSDDDIMPMLIAFIRELGRMPTWGELRVRERMVSGFPTVFRHGKKHELAERIARYCSRVPGHGDIAALCKLPDVPRSREPAKAESTDGWVYLLKSGRFYKVGRTNALGRREYEIALQLPEKATTVHTMRTDDPVGIEAYWHKRFADRRKNGEWFELTADDVKAFRRRKFM